MNNNEESVFSAYVKQQAVKQNWSMSELAKQAGIGRTTLYGLLNGATGEAKLSTVIQLAAALRVHPVVLFRHLLAELEFAGFSTTGARYRFDATGFVQDVTIPDHSVITTDSVFVKIWEIQNVGAVDWVGCQLVCMDRKADLPLMPNHIASPEAVRGLIPTQRVIAIPDTPPDARVRLGIEFTAPSYPCAVISSL